MTESTHFRPALFAFLRDLKANNDRPWFKANKERYDSEVKEPAMRFISAFAPHLAKISPHFRADPRPVGGSLFRIHRDTRFSKDKTPYKTHVGIQFRHALGKDAHAPGFYLHLEPRNVFFGAGLWRPPTAAARAVRERIAEEPSAWKRATGTAGFTKHFELQGERLKRPPRGFDPEHPLVETLKYKDFLAVAASTQKQVTTSGFEKELARRARDVAPMVRFLCEALSVPF